MKKYIFKFSAGMHVNKYNTSGFMMILSFGNNEGEFFFLSNTERTVNLHPQYLKESAKCYC